MKDPDQINQLRIKANEADISSIIQTEGSASGEAIDIILSYADILNESKNINLKNISLIEKNFNSIASDSDEAELIKKNSLEYLQFLKNSLSDSGDLFVINFCKEQILSKPWESKTTKVSQEKSEDLTAKHYKDLKVMDTISEISPRSDNLILENPTFLHKKTTSEIVTNTSPAPLRAIYRIHSGFSEVVSPKKAPASKIEFNVMDSIYEISPRLESPSKETTPFDSSEYLLGAIEQDAQSTRGGNIVENKQDAQSPQDDDIIKNLSLVSASLSNEIPKSIQVSGGKDGLESGGVFVSCASPIQVFDLDQDTIGIQDDESKSKTSSSGSLAISRNPSSPPVVEASLCFAGIGAFSLEGKSEARLAMLLNDNNVGSQTSNSGRREEISDNQSSRESSVGNASCISIIDCIKFFSNQKAR